MATTKHYETKLVLSEKAREETCKAHRAVIESFLEARLANVVGLAEGIKWKNGQPTGEPALLVLVTHKQDKGEISSENLVPGKLGDMQTDVLAVGHVFAGGCCEPTGAGIQVLGKRTRPAQGGYSVGHKNITAGTIATCVYDLLPGGSTSQPGHGIGMPSKCYILSNNHVLADSNAGAIGDAVLQPGPYDGGVDPADRIATLSRYVPISFNPPMPLTSQENLVDCAIAEGQFYDLDREIYWNGYVRGWRRKANVTVGTLVKKTGRTTHFTTGRITAINATIDVGYGGGRVARFKDQIVTTNMSEGGDSGSLVLTLDNVAVGLLFAGSATSMIANQIENVRALLRVEVAEQIL
jgi:hypothetical protein